MVRPPPSVSVPPSLKAIEVFLARANELDRDKSSHESHVLSYCCRLHAADVGNSLVIDLRSRKWLSDKVLGRLNREMADMSVYSKEIRLKICREFADKEFNFADTEDAVGMANEVTAKRFDDAATYFEVMQQFYPEKVDDEMMDQKIMEDEKRQKYCRERALEILNAIQEGRSPTPQVYKKQQRQELAEVDGLTSEPTTTTPSDNIMQYDQDGNDETRSEYTYNDDSTTSNGFGVETGNTEDEHGSSLFVEVSPPPLVSPLSSPVNRTLSKDPSGTSFPSLPAVARGQSSPKRRPSMSSSTTTATTISEENRNDAIEQLAFAVKELKDGYVDSAKKRVEEARKLLS